MVRKRRSLLPESRPGSIQELPFLLELLRAVDYMRSDEDKERAFLMSFRGVLEEHLTWNRQFREERYALYHFDCLVAYQPADDYRLMVLEGDERLHLSVGDDWNDIADGACIWPQVVCNILDYLVDIKADVLALAFLDHQEGCFCSSIHYDYVYLKVQNRPCKDYLRNNGIAKDFPLYLSVKVILDVLCKHCGTCQ